MHRLVLACLALACLAPIQGYYSAAHSTYPGDCGAACSVDLSDFPDELWDRQMRGAGHATGALDDGSYLYLGESQRAGVTYGYMATSNHTGGVCAAGEESYRFLVGPHVGKRYRCTRSLQLASGLRNWNGVQFTTYSTPNLIELTTMQYAPNCTATNTPDACCDGYQLGDGTCVGAGPCGAGCVTSALPGYSMLASAPSAALADGALVVGFGKGNTASDLWEWYKECNSDPLHGGPGGAPHACCSGGIQFTSTGLYAFSPINDSANTPADLTSGSSGIGGTGHNCDTFGGGPGYTYLGPIGRVNPYPMTWWAQHWNAALAKGWQAGLKNPTGCIASHAAANGSTAEMLATLVAPSPRSSSRADCGEAQATTGDSGSPIFVKLAGAWVYLGALESGDNPFAWHDLRWWHLPRRLGIELGGQTGGR